MFWPGLAQKKRRLESWGRPEKKHETKQKLFPNLFFAAIFDKNQQWIRNQIYFLFIVPVAILPYITLAILSPAARPKIRGRTNGVGWLGIFNKQQGILRNQFRLFLSRNFLEFLITTQAEQRFSWNSWNKSKPFVQFLSRVKILETVNSKIRFNSNKCFFLF